MRRLLVLLYLATAPAFADDTTECVVASTAKLPHIPGLTIKATKVVPMDGGVVGVRVDTDTAGQAISYAYLCRGRDVTFIAASRTPAE